MSFRLFSGGKEITDQILLAKFSVEEVGVFESLRTYRGKIFRLEDHLKRFMESARTAGFQDQVSIPEIRKQLLTALEAFKRQPSKTGDGEYFLRVTLGRFGLYVMVGERRHPEKLYQEGVALKTSPVKRTLNHAVPSGVKTTDYTNAVMASLEPKPQEIYEWIFLDHNGFVTAVRIGNLFIIKESVLLTPPTTGILNGVTRRFVIECAHKLQIPVQEIPLTRHEVYNAEEAFLTNTSWEILPVRELDGRKIGTRIPGILTQRLQKTFKEKALK